MNTSVVWLTLPRANTELLTLCLAILILDGCIFSISLSSTPACNGRKGPQAGGDQIQWSIMYVEIRAHSHRQWWWSEPAVTIDKVCKAHDYIHTGRYSKVGNYAKNRTGKIGSAWPAELNIPTVYTLHVVHELQVCKVCYLQMYDYLTWEFGVLEEIIIERSRFTLNIMTHLD